MTQRQQRALEAYRRNENGRYDINGTRYSEEEAVRNYMSLFDSLFFFGVISGRIKLVFNAPNRLSDGRLGECAKATTSAFGTTLRSSDIRIFPTNTAGCRARMIYYRQILLHEMCHAVLGTFCCRQGSCEDHREGTGWTGHGAAWQRVALALELAATDILGFYFDMARNRSCALEMKSTGRFT